MHYGLTTNHSCRFLLTQFLNKPHENEVTLREQNVSLKFCQPLELLIYFGKGFRSFHTSNIGLVGQRAAKLLAVKVGALKKKSAALAIPAEVCASVFGQDSSPPGFKSF